jgi:hypothetical protein
VVGALGQGWVRVVYASGSSICIVSLLLVVLRVGKTLAVLEFLFKAFLSQMFITEACRADALVTQPRH